MSFAELARAYVRQVDSASDGEVLLDALRLLLPRLYAAGWELPDVQPTGEELDRVEAPLARLAALLPVDLYHTVLHPLGLPDGADVGMGSLADDLADLYAELAGPLRAWDDGRTDDAFWEWRLAMRGHAGNHAIGAMGAIHAWRLKTGQSERVNG